MEENKVAQITKHTDSSRSTDSGVSGNAQTRAREIRKTVLKDCPSGYHAGYGCGCGVICRTCADKGFVRWTGTDEVAPCPKCNEDGFDEVTG